MTERKWSEFFTILEKYNFKWYDISSDHDIIYIGIDKTIITPEDMGILVDYGVFEDDDNEDGLTIYV